MIKQQIQLELLEEFKGWLAANGGAIFDVNDIDAFEDYKFDADNIREYK